MLAFYTLGEVDDREAERAQAKAEREAPRIAINDLPAEILSQILREHLNTLLARLNGHSAGRHFRLHYERKFKDTMLVSKLWLRITQEHLWGKEVEPKPCTERLREMIIVLGVENWDKDVKNLVYGEEDVYEYGDEDCLDFNADIWGWVWAAKKKSVSWDKRSDRWVGFGAEMIARHLVMVYWCDPASFPR